VQYERVERLGEEAWAGVAAIDRGDDDQSRFGYVHRHFHLKDTYCPLYLNAAS
jgi:hypothetical protein